MDEQTPEQDFKTNLGFYKEHFTSIQQLVLSSIDYCSKYSKADSQIN